MKSTPKPFLPTRHEIVNTGLSTLSLEGACPPVERIANEVAAILKSELEAAPGSEKNGGVKDRIWGLISKIKDGVLTGASAIKIWEFFKSSP